MQHCAENKARIDVFDETQMRGEEAFMEVINKKGVTKTEMKALNYMQINSLCFLGLQVFFLREYMVFGFGLWWCMNYPRCRCCGRSVSSWFGRVSSLLR